MNNNIKEAKYSAYLEQNDRLVVAYHSDDFVIICDLVFNILNNSNISEINAKIIDNSSAKIVTRQSSIAA